MLSPMANNEPPPNWLTVLYRAFLSPTKAKKSYSQFGEDLILQTLPNFPKKGFFVDIGCHAPRRGSNTYGLYKRGWNGILVDLEPEKVWACKLARPRDIAVLAAVSNKEESVEIYSPKNFSVLSTIAPDEKIKRDFYVSGTTQSKTLTRLLSEHHAPKRIDFLSIDTEGADYQVLEGLDFNIYTPKCICIEKPESDETIEKIIDSKIYHLMKTLNYQMAGWSGASLIFTNRNIAPLD